MGSILSNSPSQPTQQTAQNPLEAINNLINGILESPDPNATFQQMLNASPELKSKWDEMNRYGNGDPKAAFINYMNATGKQAIGQNIMQVFKSKFGSRFQS